MIAAADLVADPIISWANFDPHDTEMSDKAVVIGATGLLGSSTVKLLSQTRHVIELRQRGSARQSFAAETRIVDLFEPRSLADAISDATTILFFPSFSTPSTLPFDVRQELAVSTTALANLVEAAAATSRHAHIVFPSTGGAIYGNSEAPCTEQTPAAPESSYAFGKLISEEILKFYARLGKTSFTIFRFSNLYGYSGKRLVPQGVIDRFLDDAVEEKVSSVWVEPSSTRDYLFVDDAAHAVRAVLDNPTNGWNSTFNVASGNSTSIREILSIIKKTTGGRHEFKYDSSKYGGVRHIAIDTTSFRKAYPEWNVLTPIDEGIAITWRRKLMQSSACSPADMTGG